MNERARLDGCAHEDGDDGGGSCRRGDAHVRAGVHGDARQSLQRRVF